MIDKIPELTTYGNKQISILRWSLNMCTDAGPHHLKLNDKSHGKLGVGKFKTK